MTKIEWTDLWTPDSNEIIAAKVLLEERVQKASKQELDAYNTFRHFHIFNRMGDDAMERIIDRDRKLKY